MRSRKRAATSLALALLVSACAPAPTHRAETLLVFGSLAELRFANEADERVDAALSETTELLAQLHREWHPWEPGPLTAVNDAIAIGSAAPATASIQDLIARAKQLVPATDFLFDPAAGGLIALWGFHTSTFPVTQPAPSAQDIAGWLEAAPSMADVHVEDGTVFSRNRRVKLDFGGMAEGVAVERVRAIMQKQKVQNVLLTMGGDIYAMGDAGGRPWSVGLRDPYGGVLGSVDLAAGESLFSSGNYNKFREAPDGARWPHILDVRTGYPTRGTAAVAVLHHDAVLADIASTAIFIGGPARFESMTHRLGIRCAMMLTEENELLITAAMDARIKLHRDPVRLGPAIGEPGPC